MTAQFPDMLTFQGKNLEIIQRSGVIFSPSQHGFTPKPWSSGCWRGYVAHFSVKDDELRLRTFSIYQDSFLESWQGVFSEVSRFQYEPCRYYKNLNFAIGFTGKLVGATDFVSAYYKHLGYLVWYGYQDVQLLTFENGIVTDVQDFSEQATSTRQHLANNPAYPHLKILHPTLTDSWTEYW
jgi:hypothetical protein